MTEQIGEFTRILEWTPAFDKRDPNPHKNYGIHGVELRFVLKGPKGATQFVLSTNWQLPHVTKETAGRHYPAIGEDIHWKERSMPSDLGYHSARPMYEDQAVVSEECPYIGGVPCYYDGSTLNATPVYERLLAEGEEGVWAALEHYYRSIFDDRRAGDW